MTTDKNSFLVLPYRFTLPSFSKFRLISSSVSVLTTSSLLLLGLCIVSHHIQIATVLVALFLIVVINVYKRFFYFSIKKPFLTFFKLFQRFLFL